MGSESSVEVEEYFLQYDIPTEESPLCRKNVFFGLARLCFEKAKKRTLY